MYYLFWLKNLDRTHGVKLRIQLKSSWIFFFFFFLVSPIIIYIYI